LFLERSNDRGRHETLLFLEIAAWKLLANPAATTTSRGVQEGGCFHKHYYIDGHYQDWLQKSIHGKKKRVGAAPTLLPTGYVF
jgi:hypothetical protein